MELEEVSFQASPDELRQISQFLLFSAERMEKHGADYGHDHLKDFLEKGERAEGPDVIVASMP